MLHVNVDDCRIRKDNAPENFAVMRRLAVNLLGREKSHKRGLQGTYSNLPSRVLNDL